MADTDRLSLGANRTRDLPETVESKSTNEFKVLEVREDGTVVLGTEDDRAFTATLKEGLERPRKGSKVVITSDGLDESEAPKNAVVSRLL